MPAAICLLQVERIRLAVLAAKLPSVIDPKYGVLSS